MVLPLGNYLSCLCCAHEYVLGRYEYVYTKDGEQWFIMLHIYTCCDSFSWVHGSFSDMWLIYNYYDVLLNTGACMNVTWSVCALADWVLQPRGVRLHFCTCAMPRKQIWHWTWHAPCPCTQLLMIYQTVHMYVYVCLSLHLRNNLEHKRKDQSFTGGLNLDHYFQKDIDWIDTMFTTVPYDGFYKRSRGCQNNWHAACLLVKNNMHGRMRTRLHMYMQLIN